MGVAELSRPRPELRPEPVYLAVAPAEMERRRQAVRTRLQEIGADALVATTAFDNFLNCGVRWLTGNTVAYRGVVVIYADGSATLIENGPKGGRQELKDEQAEARGADTVLHTPSINSVHYTQGYEAELVLADLQRHGCRRLALVNPKAMASGFLDELKAYGNLELIDDTDFVDRFRALKSPEEIRLIRAAAALQDEAYAAMMGEIRPGMRVSEVGAIGEFEMARRGGRYGVVLYGAAPPGAPATWVHLQRSNRILERGDSVNVLMEIASPNGLFTEVCRMMTLGEATPGQREAFERASAAQEALIDFMRAGQLASEVYANCVDHMVSQGHPPDLRLFAHGQGYDIVERPLIRDDETMMLEPGMLLACHPKATSAQGDTAMLCDNVFVTEGAPEWLHRTERKLFELDV